MEATEVDPKVNKDGSPQMSDAQINQLVTEGKIALTLSGGQYVFKIPDFEEFIVVEESLPILPTGDKEIGDEADMDPASAMEALAADPVARKRFFQRVNKTLCVCSLEPKLTNEDEVPEAVEGFQWVRWLRADERAVAFACLMGLSTYTREAALELRPFSERTSSVPWMRLDKGTADSQVKSSTQEGNSDSQESNG